LMNDNRKNIDLSKVASRVLSASEKHRSFRTVVVMAGVCFLVWVICNTILELVDEAFWRTVALSILAALLGPSGVVTIIKIRTKRFTRTTIKRVQKLEHSIDPNRSSSQL